eukprot:842012-Rhodomonas_salina.1
MVSGRWAIRSASRLLQTAVTRQDRKANSISSAGGANRPRAVNKQTIRRFSASAVMEQHKPASHCKFHAAGPAGYLKHSITAIDQLALPLH